MHAKLAAFFKSSFILFVLLNLQACSGLPSSTCCEEGHPERLVSALGYAAKSQYKNLSQSEQILRAMQDAKENAYRSLLERVGEISVHYAAKEGSGVTGEDGKKSALIVNVSGVLRHVRLVHVIPMNEDIFEAKVEVDMNDPGIYRAQENRAGAILEDVRSGGGGAEKKPGNKLLYWIGL